MRTLHIWSACQHPYNGKVYRKELRPVLRRGAKGMDDLFNAHARRDPLASAAIFLRGAGCTGAFDLSAWSDDERNDHHHVDEVEDDVGDRCGQDASGA